jgi:hypothetical protein
MNQKSDGSDAKRDVKSDVPKISKTRKTRKTEHSAAKKLIFSTNANLARLSSFFQSWGGVSRGGIT